MSGSLMRSWCWRSATLRFSVAEGPSTAEQERENDHRQAEHARELHDGKDRHDDGDGNPEHLRGEVSVDGVGVRLAGVDELHADLVDVADGREATAEVSKASRAGTIANDPLSGFRSSWSRTFSTS